MNKKQMIKEQKKLKEQRKEVEKLFKDDKDIYVVFKIALGVILFIGLAFVVINFANGTWKLTKGSTSVTEIDPRMLIAGTLFDKEEDEYLVIAYNMKEEKEAIYGVMASNYSGDRTLYLLDLSSGFNDSFIGEKTVISNDLTKLKFGGPTLLVIKGNKITKSYTTEKDITKFFSQK